MKLSGIQIFICIIGSLFFLALPFVFSPDLTRSDNVLMVRGAQRDLTGYAMMLCVFYLNYFLLIPRLYFRKKYVVYTLILIGCFILVVYIPKMLFPWVQHLSVNGPPLFRRTPSLLMQVGHNIFIFLMVVFVSLTLRINTRLKQTHREKLGAELSYLKAQINPHFLFNSLNSIYSLAIEQSHKTADAVLRLSGMMRYVISESGRDFVSLEKELSYIHDYIEMQKIRLGNTIMLNYEIYGDLENNKIAPLVLIPFVENAFKYGVNSEENSVIHIAIAIHENTLKLDVKNNKVKTHPEHAVKTGVGIGNTRSRLRLLYPGKHDLAIHDNAHEFNVTLQLNLS